MATIAFESSPSRRLSIETIDTVVSARLGSTRIQGDEQPTCFNRQIAMYLARHVGGWSTTAIGQFYNGRDHLTVCSGIQRIEALRENDPEVDLLLAGLRQQLSTNRGDDMVEINGREHLTGLSAVAHEEVADRIAQRICAYLEERVQRKSK